MTRQDGAIPHIDIILLGSPGVGKATFLSRLPHVQHPSVTKRERLNAQHLHQPRPQISTTSGLTRELPNDSQATLVAPSTAAIDPTPSNDSETTLIPPSTSSTTNSTSAPPPAPPPSLPSLTQPLTFNVQLFSRPYRITIHPSNSPLFIDPFPPNPHLLILTYSIPDRRSLFNIQHYWMPQYHLHYPTSTIPILLLGLKRDLRTAKKRPAINLRTGEEVEDNDDEAEAICADTNRTGQRRSREEYECVMPEEGLQVAREMRLDRYAECSAMTGELMWEATQDITRMAAGTTVDGGEYASEMCVIM